MRHLGFGLLLSRPENRICRLDYRRRQRHRGNNKLRPRFWGAQFSSQPDIKTDIQADIKTDRQTDRAAKSLALSPSVCLRASLSGRRKQHARICGQLASWLVSLACLIPLYVVVWPAEEAELRGRKLQGIRE